MHPEASPASPDQLYDLAACAQRLATSVQHVRHLVFELCIPFIKLGAKLRFREADLRDWLAAARVEVESDR